MRLSSWRGACLIQTPDRFKQAKHPSLISIAKMGVTIDFLLRVSSTNLDCLKGQQILNVIRCIGPQTALQPFSTYVFSFARLNEQDYIALIPQLLKQSCLVAGNGHENMGFGEQWNSKRT